MEPEAGRTARTLPTLGQILKDQMALSDSAEATDRWLAASYAKRCGERRAGRCLPLCLAFCRFIVNCAYLVNQPC